MSSGRMPDEIQSCENFLFSISYPLIGAGLPGAISSSFLLADKSSDSDAR